MKHLTLFASVIGLCLNAALAQAQEPRTVRVDGRRMSVRTSRIGSPIPGPPVVVFEAGAGGGLTSWDPVFDDVADFAAVVAYDRAGIGRSEPDGELPTPRHVAENLHALLDQLGADPPYVLVGHSLGGPYIRMFTAMYPEEVGGLVFVDPTQIITEEDERALNEARGWDYQRALELAVAGGITGDDDARGREENWRRRLADPQLSPQNKVILELLYTRFAEFHSLPPVPDIPVSVLIAGRFNARRFAALPDSSANQFNCEPRECHARWLEVSTEIVSRLAQESTNGTVRVVQNSGHFIHAERPRLVIQAIRDVVEARAR